MAGTARLTLSDGPPPSLVAALGSGGEPMVGSEDIVAPAEALSGVPSGPLDRTRGAVLRPSGATTDRSRRLPGWSSARRSSSTRWRNSPSPEHSRSRTAARSAGSEYSTASQHRHPVQTDRHPFSSVLAG